MINNTALATVHNLISKLTNAKEGLLLSLKGWGGGVGWGLEFNLR